VHLPTEDITRYWELSDEIQNIESEVSRLEGELAELEGSIHYLNDLLVQGTDEESSTPEATDLARSHARNYCRYAMGHESLEGTIAEIQNRLGTPEQVDTETVAAYVFTQMLVERLTQKVQQHPFPEELERAREKYAGLVDESRWDGSRGFWEDVLRPALEDRRDRIEHELDEAFTGRIFKRSRLVELIEETIEDLDRTQSSFEEYKKLDGTREEVRNRWEEMDARLRCRWNELEDRQREKRNALETRRRRLSDLRTKRERVEEQLADRRVGQYTQLPMVNLNDLQPESLDGIDGLNELIDRGFLEIEEVSRALTHVFDGIEEPIEDQALCIDRSNTSEAFLLANDVNYELVTEHVGEHSGRIPQTSLDTFDNVTHVDLADPFAIHAVGVFAPIELKNTSEFGTIDEYYTDPNRDLSAQFDAQVTDEDVTRHFAYPELFAAGSRITAHFENR